MSLVQLLYVGNLLNALLVLFTDIFYYYGYKFIGPSDYWYDEALHIPHSLNFYT